MQRLSDVGAAGLKVYFDVEAVARIRCSRAVHRPRRLRRVLVMDVPLAWWWAAAPNSVIGSTARG